MRVEPKSGEISHLMSKLGNSKYRLLRPIRRVQPFDMERTPNGKVLRTLKVRSGVNTISWVMPTS